MADTSCMFCHPAEQDLQYIVFESTYWTVFLANEQNYPGRCIIPLKRHCACLSGVTPAEITDFLTVVQLLEHTFCTKFGATHCNWSCLMNGAYAQQPYNPHTHFHFIPRYREPVHTSEGDFHDDCFGRHYTLSHEFQLPVKDRLEFAQRLRAELQAAAQSL